MRGRKSHRPLSCLRAPVKVNLSSTLQICPWRNPCIPISGRRSLRNGGRIAGPIPRAINFILILQTKGEGVCGIPS